MKKIFFAIAITSTAFLMSCSKNLLDQIPKDALSDATVWNDPQAATQFVNGIYGNMPSGFNRNYQGWAKGLYLLNGATDDGDVCMPWTSAEQLQTASFLPSGSPWAELYADYYRLVRQTNVALANLDKLSDVATRNSLVGQAHFLRAYIYHDLLRWYGMKSNSSEPTGVVLIENPLTPDDDLQIPRSSYDEVVSFIINDLNKAIELLPSKGQIEAGRATKGAAYALQSRVYLYAERWQEAAAAAKKVMDAGEYSLFPDYRTIFLTKNNEEIIYAKKFQDPDKIHLWANAGFDVINSPRSYKGAGDAGWGGNVPTQNFVESYEMTDGQAQSQSPLHDATHPFDHLDPRFEATVVHNGSTFRGHVMEMYPGGADVTGQPEDSKTGYQLRKFHQEQYPVYSKSSDQDWVYIRFAEVLLNYAEAQNEAAGPDQSIYDAVNLVRQRAGMPNMETNLLKEDLRAHIRNERRVELAFEEHRFFDIRRWRIAESLLNGPLYGIQYAKVGNTITYTRYPFENPEFPCKNVCVSYSSI